MSEVQIGLIGIAALFVLIGLRAPIGVAMIGVSFAGIWHLLGWNVAWGALGVIPYEFSTNWVLSSVPMFLLMGFVCYHARLTEGLFRAARFWLGRMPGGLAISGVMGCAGFAAVCGSSIACAAAMGRIAVPEMTRQRYDPGLATSSIAAGGTIGALIPPSIIMILYGIIAQTSITRLFLGGIAIGALTLASYIAVILIRVALNPSLAPIAPEKATLQQKIASLKGVWPVVLIMVGIFGGLFTGFFTPTEAGAVGALLSCIVALLARTLTWQRFKNALLETLLTTTFLLIIGIGASLLQRFMALSGAGGYLTELVIGQDASIAWILFGLVSIYLVLGMFMEPIGAMLLTLPIVLPIIQSADLSLVWFGVVLTKLLEMGMLTPPVGMNVFVIKGVVGNLASLAVIFKGIMWFLFADLLVLLLMLVFPELVLFLPRWVG